jgi:hypothetical protein
MHIAPRGVAFGTILLPQWHGVLRSAADELCRHLCMAGTASMMLPICNSALGDSYSRLLPTYDMDGHLCHKV